MLNFLVLVLPLLKNKKVVYISLIIACLVSLSVLLYSGYNHIYNKGYNDSLRKEQEKIDIKYKKAIKEIQDFNEKQKEIEGIERNKIKEEHLKLKDKFIKNQRELHNILSKSKSGLSNKVCEMTDREREFLNEK